MTQRFQFWEYTPRIPKHQHKKNICTPMFTAALVTLTKIRKQPTCSSADEWIKKLWYIYTMEYYSAIKKEVNLTLYNTMDGPAEY